MGGVGPESKATNGGSTQKGLTFAVANFGLVLIISTVSAYALSRLYGVTVIGQFALVAAPYTLLYLISSVNERAGLIRKLAVTPRHSPRVAPLFWNVFGFSIVLTTLMGLVVGGASVIYLRHIGQSTLITPMLATLVGYILVENSSWNFDSLLSSYREGQSLFIARISQVCTILFVSVAMHWAVGGVWGLVIGLVAGFAVGLAIRLALVIGRGSLRTSLRAMRTELPELRSFIAFGIRLTPANAVNVLSVQAPVWVLGGLVDITLVGAWSRAFGLAQRLQDLSFRFNEIMMPTLASRTDDPRSFGRTLDKAIRGLVPFIVMIVSVGAGAAHGIMGLFGPGFSAATTALQLLLVVFGVLGVASALGSALIASGLPNAVTSAVAVRAVVTLGLLWPMTSWWGLTGTAGALLAGAIAAVFVQVLVLHRRGFLAGFERAGQAHLGWATAGAGAAGFVVSLAIESTLPGAIGTLITLAGGCLAYVAVLGMLGGVRILDHSLLDHRLSRILARLPRALRAS